MIYSIDKNYPVACHIRTEYLTSYQGNGFGHYVAATGYSYGFVGETSENDVKYNDPHYDSRYFGTHTVDWREMEDAINGNAGLFIRKS